MQFNPHLILNGKNFRKFLAKVKIKSKYNIIDQLLLWICTKNSNFFCILPQPTLSYQNLFCQLQPLALGIDDK